MKEIRDHKGYNQDLAEFVNLALDACEAKIAMVSVFEEKETLIAYNQGFSKNQIASFGRLVEMTKERGSSVIIEDFSALEKDFVIDNLHGLCFYAAVPFKDDNEDVN